MQIDVKALLVKGKEKESFSFSYTAPEKLIDIPLVKIDGDVKVFGDVDIVSVKKAYIDATVSYCLKGACSLCGGRAEVPVTAELNELFVDSKEEDDAYTFEKGVIDLTKAVNDAIIMSAPIQVLCRENCKGICRKCGQNLNDGNCGCE